MTELLVPRERIPLRHALLCGWLPSPIKIFIYRLFFGYRIGRHVRLAFGSIVVGNEVDLGDHVEIGMFAVVVGRRIRIGRHSSIGATSVVSCREIEIGEDARIREQVFVGGPELPESRFSLGSRTVVLQRTSINPTKPVVIGDDSGIGGHCLIFTHSAWLSSLEGYPVSYEPVTLGKSVWLPWRVFVMPGASIGDGSIIGANSLVMGEIPDHVLAVGSPARVIRRSPDFPQRPTSEAQLAMLESIVGEFRRYISAEGIQIKEEPPFLVLLKKSRRFRLLRIRDEGMPASVVNPGDTVLIERTIPAEAFVSWRARGVYWLDVVGKTRSVSGCALTEELASFFGRYGIRFARDSG